jgi:subtilisin family serine protease
VYPGNELCTLPLAGGFITTAPCWVFDMVISTSSLRTTGTYGYYWSAGTSMAAPHATGVAAIIITQTKEWAYSRPEYLRPDHIFAEMRRRADYVGSSTTREYGQGRVNPVFP